MTPALSITLKIDYKTDTEHTYIHWASLRLLLLVFLLFTWSQFSFSSSVCVTLLPAPANIRIICPTLILCFLWSSRLNVSFYSVLNNHKEMHTHTPTLPHEQALGDNGKEKLPVSNRWEMWETCRALRLYRNDLLDLLFNTWKPSSASSERCCCSHFSNCKQLWCNFKLNSCQIKSS